ARYQPAEAPAARHPEAELPDCSYQAIVAASPTRPSVAAPRCRLDHTGQLFALDGNPIGNPVVRTDRDQTAVVRRHTGFDLRRVRFARLMHRRGRAMPYCRLRAEPAAGYVGSHPRAGLRRSRALSTQSVPALSPVEDDQRDADRDD